MRQAGIIAAAGLVALEDHTEFMLSDHQHAQQLAAGLVELGIDVVPVETNIINIRLSPPHEPIPTLLANKLVEALTEAFKQRYLVFFFFFALTLKTRCSGT